MRKKEKKDIIIAWDEVEEAHCSLSDYSDGEVIDCVEAITKRLAIAMELLGKYFTDDELHEEIAQG